MKADTNSLLQDPTIFQELVQLVDPHVEKYNAMNLRDPSCKWMARTAEVDSGAPGKKMLQYYVCTTGLR